MRTTQQRQRPGDSTGDPRPKAPNGSLWLDAGLVMVLALPAILPILVALPRGYDTPLHILRLVWLDQALAEGWSVFPRWSASLGLGYGYPLFNFYAPAAYIPGTVLIALGADASLAFSISLALLALTAALGAWRLAADIVVDLSSNLGVGRVAAMLAGVVYLYAPYLLINLYVRGAIAETAAQAGLPWAILLVRRTLRARDPLDTAPIAALVLAGILFSHTISLLLVPPFILWIAAAHLVKQPRRWLRLFVVGLAGIGLSALFWIPLILERTAAGTAAYQATLPANVDVFLDVGTAFWASIPYPYAQIPSGLRFGLSPWHLLLGLAGLWAARKQPTHELFAFALAMVGVAVLQIRELEFLWSLGGLIEIVQAPSRLQTFFYLSAAILGAVAITRLPAFIETAPLAISLGLTMMAVGAPWTIAMPTWLEATNHTGLAELAHAETAGSSFGLSVYPEFLPRWVDYPNGLDTPAEPESSDAIVSLTAQGPAEYQLTASAANPWTLRTADFYFPGWAAWVDGERVPVSASTSLGLVSVAIPAGQHRVHVAFVGSTAQNAALWVSTLTALIAAGYLGWRRRRIAAAFALGLTSLGVWAALHPSPPAQAVTRSNSARVDEALDLLDARIIPGSSERLIIGSTWYTPRNPDDLTLRWAVRDSTGATVAEAHGRPWFDHLHTQAWPAGLVADDRTEIRLPGGLAAGNYSVWVCVQPEAQREQPCEPGTLALETVTLATTPTQVIPAQPSRFTFAGGLDLVDAVLETPAGDRPLGGVAPVVSTSDRLVIRLIWRVRDWIDQGHLESSPILMTRQGERISYATYALGGMQAWLRLLPPGSLITDRQPVMIDPNAAGGRYPLTVRVFDPATGDYLAVLGPDGVPGPDTVSVGDVRVMALTSTRVGVTRRATIGDLAEVIGFETIPAEARLEPGATLTVTLVYRSLRTTDRELTGFLHVYAAGSGLIAQHDSPPLSGNNPTTGWLPGEVIRDVVQVTIDLSAQPGRYQLLWGLYDPVNGERVSITLPDGSQPQERALWLQEVVVGQP